MTRPAIRSVPKTPRSSWHPSNWLLVRLVKGAVGVVCALAILGMIFRIFEREPRKPLRVFVWEYLRWVLPLSGKVLLG